MKRIFCTICLLAVCFGFAYAQEKTDSEKMKKERIRNMQLNLKLTAQESKLFWSAYGQFLDNEIKYHEAYKKNLEKRGIKLKAPGKNKEVIEKLSDKDLAYLQDQKFELRKNMHNLELSFYKKLKSILTPRHIQDFYNIDEKFKREMVSKRKAEAEKKDTAPNQVNGGVKKR